MGMNRGQKRYRALGFGVDDGAKPQAPAEGARWQTREAWAFGMLRKNYLTPNPMA